MAKPSQTTINFPRLSPSQKEEIDLQAAMWCYMGNHSFTMYENAYGKQFLNALNSAYKPLSRKSLSGPLLDAAFSAVKKRIDELIASLPNINVSSDESSIVNSTRICNISIHSESGSIHYLSQDIGAKRMNAINNADWLRGHLLELSNHNLSRINSVTTDTCNTMFSTWEELEKNDDFAHYLFFPCDSHGIQLLIKDILELPSFADAVKQAQTLVNTFRKAHLQYARLRESQLHFYGRHQSLILSVITRWGTQYRLIQSILRNKDALKCYASDFGDMPATQRLKNPVIEIIRSRDFWMKIRVCNRSARARSIPLTRVDRLNVGPTKHSDRSDRLQVGSC